MIYVINLGLNLNDKFKFILKKFVCIKINQILYYYYLYNKNS